MKYLKDCIDFKKLKENLDEKKLKYINEELKQYIDFVAKNYNLENYIEEYFNIYGSSYVVDWFEGLMDTEEFIKEMKEYNI